jgi:hypothetical protein
MWLEMSVSIQVDVSGEVPCLTGAEAEVKSEVEADAEAEAEANPRAEGGASWRAARTHCTWPLHTSPAPQHYAVITLSKYLIYIHTTTLYPQRDISDNPPRHPHFIKMT